MFATFIGVFMDILSKIYYLSLFPLMYLFYNQWLRRRCRLFKKYELQGTSCFLCSHIQEPVVLESACVLS